MVNGNRTISFEKFLEIWFLIVEHHAQTSLMQYVYFMI